MLDRIGSGLRDPRADAQTGRELDTHAEQAGLMHDLGHGLATLSYLVDGMSEDPDLPVDTRHRVELMEKQIDLLRRALDRPALGRSVVDVRELLTQLVSSTALSTSTWIGLRPGHAVDLLVERTTLWRMVTNLVDNAVRAAGPRGTVELDVNEGQAAEVRVDVVDDGPGFGAGPPGVAARGLGIVSGLAERCGADIRVRSDEPCGVRVRLVFPSSATVPAATGFTTTPPGQRRVRSERLEES